MITPKPVKLLQFLLIKLLKGFYYVISNVELMSGKQFFLDRYTQLGWEFKEPKPKLSIRINQINARAKKLPERLRKLGVELEKIPFLQSGYWVVRSKASAGATAEYLLGMYSIQEAAAQIPATIFTAYTWQNGFGCLSSTRRKNSSTRRLDGKHWRHNSIRYKQGTVSRNGESLRAMPHQQHNRLQFRCKASHKTEPIL